MYAELHTVDWSWSYCCCIFPNLRIQQLTVFGCKSWGFVIYNQFSACFLCTRLPFVQFVSCPEGPHRIPVVLVQSLPASPLPLSLCLPPPHRSLHLPLYMHCIGPSAAQAVGTVYKGTSSGRPASTTPTR